MWYLSHYLKKILIVQNIINIQITSLTIILSKNIKTVSYICQHTTAHAMREKNVRSIYYFKPLKNSLRLVYMEYLS